MTRPYPSLSHWERVWGEGIVVSGKSINDKTNSLLGSISEFSIYN